MSVSLSDAHRSQLLSGSGLTEEIVHRRGYRTVNSPTELLALGFPEFQASQVPALLIPVYRPNGSLGDPMIRPDEPLTGKKGKPMKYQSRRGSAVTLDCHPLGQQRVLDPTQPLIVTEGVKKGDALTAAGAAAVALTGGVYGATVKGSPTALRPEWDAIPLQGREVTVLFDSDGRSNKKVLQAAERLRAALKARGARVKVLFPNPGPGDQKRGADDALLAHGGDLTAMLSDCWTPAESREEGAGTSRSSHLSVLNDALAACGGELWHDPCGGAFVTFTAGSKVRSVAVDSEVFRTWCAGALYRATGKGVGDAALRELLPTFRAMALYDGCERPRGQRWLSDPAGSTVYHALGDDSGSVVRTDASGSVVVPWDQAPVRFVLSPHALPLPAPMNPSTDAEERAAFASLARYVNVDEAGLSNAWAFLVGCFLPSGALPILSIAAEAGSGKSFAMSAIRGLVDPVRGRSRSLPKNGEWGPLLKGNALLAFDNLSGLSGEESDALCRIVSGEGFSTRQLYTVDEEVVWETRCPVIITGVTDVVSRHDLLSRTLPLPLQRLPGEPRLETELRPEYALDLPLMLGALHRRLSRSLRQMASTPAQPFRLADFARWATAAEGDWEQGSFAVAYEQAISGARAALMEGSELVRSMELWASWEPGPWPASLSATDLLERLRTVAGDASRSKGFPQSSARLGMDLTRFAEALRTLGWTLETRRDGLRRWWEISPPASLSLRSHAFPEATEPEKTKHGSRRFASPYIPTAHA